MASRLPARIAFGVALAAFAFGPPTLAGAPLPASGAASLHLAKVASYHLPEGRYGTAVVANGDDLYIIGGSNDAGTPLDDILRFNGATGKTETIGRLEIARRYHRAVLAGQRIYVLGGNSARLPGSINVFEDTVEVIDLATRKVTFAANLPEAKAHFGCALLDGRIYVLGGEVIRGRNVSCSNSTEIYDIAANRWAKGANLPRPAEGVATVVESSIVMAGGFSGLAQLDDVMVYNPRANAWGMLPKLCQPVSAHALVFLDHYLLLIGDFNEKADLVAYDLNDRSSALFELKDDVGWHTAAAVSQGRIYVVGGAAWHSRSALDDIQVFELAKPAARVTANP